LKGAQRFRENRNPCRFTSREKRGTRGCWKKKGSFLNPKGRKEEQATTSTKVATPNGPQENYEETDKASVT